MADNIFRVLKTRRVKKNQIICLEYYKFLQKNCL